MITNFPLLAFQTRPHQLNIESFVFSNLWRRRPLSWSHRTLTQELWWLREDWSGWVFDAGSCDVTKGQLISEANFKVFIWTKIPELPEPIFLWKPFVVYYVNEALNQLAQIVKMLRMVANFRLCYWLKMNLSVICFVRCRGY